ncbi:MAG: hypothetical protein GXP10_08650 [Gammaproteobacteria bacterium]|nr:hypothetical protein [Gammaproteobacteria bacterium]
MNHTALQSILVDLNKESPDIEASAIMSIDGLVMASQLPTDMDEDRLGAVSAAIVSLGDQAMIELICGGTMKQIVVSGEAGCMMITHAGDDAVVATIIKANAELGLVSNEIQRAAIDVTEELLH